MRIGVPKEIKNEEYRAGLVPSSVYELTQIGHEVFVEKSLGLGIGFSDEEYIQAGAQILNTAEEVFQKSEMIVKVKEPQQSEVAMLQKGQILFTYLHLAPDRPQTVGLQKSGCVAIAYETVTSPYGGLPLLTPMSEVAGRMSIQVGAHCLEKQQKGRGILLGGVPGVFPAKVVIIGGGVAGTNAARMAMGMGAEVTIIDRSIERLKALDLQFDFKLRTVYSTEQTIESHVKAADLVIGSVLTPGGAAPKLVTKDMIQQMNEGAVLVDIAIDQGGCFETSKPTTHSEPTYEVDGVIHYCVTNMPGAVPRTSAFALNNATLPFVIALANKGYKKAFEDDPYLREGLNVYHGKITNHAVAEALDLEYSPLDTLFAG